MPRPPNSRGGDRQRVWIVARAAELLALTTTRERRIRRPLPPVEVAYRMAYVGTVSTHDREGTVIATKRFAATANEGPETLLERVAREVCHLIAR
jgi:hypothetical protein